VFRYALSGSRTAWVRLEEELEAVRDYLEVERIRFGERLQVSVDVAPGTGDTLVPPLVLQPLVENAVLHGIGSRTSGGQVRIDVAQHIPGLVLRVEDDGPGPGRSTHRGAGTSLNNLRERLRLVYGGRASVETTERDGGGFSVTLRLPVEEPA
jgi:sensor histidine kinase YesM